MTRTGTSGFYDKYARHYIYSATGNFGTESQTRIQVMSPTLAGPPMRSMSAA